MFYCCVGAFPVFFEIHAKEGDLVALSEWSFTEPLWMHNLAIIPIRLTNWARGARATRAAARSNPRTRRTEIPDFEVGCPWRSPPTYR